MKILWLMKKYLDVAVDKSARIEMLGALRRMGHDPRLLTGYKRIRDDYGLPGAIEYVPTIKARGLNHVTFFLSAGAMLARRLATWQPDVVIMDANTCMAGWPFHLARRLGLLRTPFILDVRSMPVEVRGTLGRLEERLFGLAVRYAGRWMDGITVITPFMRQTLVERYGLDAERVGVWASAVSLEHFDSARFSPEETAAFRRDLGLHSRFVFLYHGSLSPTRGIGTAIRALAAVGDRAADVSYLIVGRGAALADLKREAQELGLASRVLFQEAVPYDEIPRYVAVADAGMVPWPSMLGWRTGSPLKLMEYLAMSKPALVTDIEAHRDLLGEVPFAVYGGRGDVEGWADGLLRLRAALEERQATLSATARSYAVEHLSWDRQAERLANYLEGVQVFRCSGVQAANEHRISEHLNTRTPEHLNT